MIVTFKASAIEKIAYYAVWVLIENNEQSKTAYGYSHIAALCCLVIKYFQLGPTICMFQLWMD